MLLRRLENHFSLYLINIVYRITFLFLMGYYYVRAIWHVLIFKIHLTMLSFEQLLLFSDIWKGPYYCALIIYKFFNQLKCTHLRWLRKILLLPVKSIFYRIKFLWNYILLTLLVRILQFSLWTCFIKVLFQLDTYPTSRKDCVTWP